MRSRCAKRMMTEQPASAATVWPGISITCAINGSNRKAAKPLRMKPRRQQRKVRIVGEIGADGRCNAAPSTELERKRPDVPCDDSDQNERNSGLGDLEFPGQCNRQQPLEYIAKQGDGKAGFPENPANVARPNAAAAVFADIQLRLETHEIITGADAAQ